MADVSPHSLYSQITLHHWCGADADVAAKYYLWTGSISALSNIWFEQSYQFHQPESSMKLVPTMQNRLNTTTNASAVTRPQLSARTPSKVLNRLVISSMKKACPFTPDAHLYTCFLIFLNTWFICRSLSQQPPGERQGTCPTQTQNNDRPDLNKDVGGDSFQLSCVYWKVPIPVSSYCKAELMVHVLTEGRL